MRSVPYGFHSLDLCLEASVLAACLCKIDSALVADCLPPVFLSAPCAFRADRFSMTSPFFHSFSSFFHCFLSISMSLLFFYFCLVKSQRDRAPPLGSAPLSCRVCCRGSAQPESSSAQSKGLKDSSTKHRVEIESLTKLRK